MFSFTNGLREVGRGTGSRSGTQGEGQRGDNQSLESWQIQGMGEAPWELSISRGTMGLGDPGRYLFGEDTGQQGTGSGLGFALPEYGNQGVTQAVVSGTTAEMGFPNLWASQATGTGMTGLDLTQLATGTLGVGPPSAWGAIASAGPGQWARPTTGTGISGVSFAQPGTGNQGSEQTIALGATTTGGLVQGASPGNKGGGQATASGATATGGPVQGASPTTGTGTNVAGLQGPRANAPPGMPPGSVGTGVMPGMAIPPAGMGPGGMGGQGPAGQPSMVGWMSLPGEYSGIGSCLDKLGDALHGPDLITRPVRWQWAVAGDSGKISTFTAEVGSLLTFQAFLMMREGSAMVTTVHSIAKFFSLSATTESISGLWAIGLLHANRGRSSSRQPKAEHGSRNRFEAGLHGWPGTWLIVGPSNKWYRGRNACPTPLVPAAVVCQTPPRPKEGPHAP